MLEVSRDLEADGFVHFPLEERFLKLPAENYLKLLDVEPCRPQYAILNAVNDPRYRETHVYGNILIEPDGAGNSQIVHYGGDSGTTEEYRKGDLYFYNNTVISTRSGNTTLVRLSTPDIFNHPPFQ